ncbi:lipid-A-disaccharide synthase [Pontibacter ummariensis]|uniref:Lipid-A-disaccharide synthase n=1 Tax=Pontibacter ummariensis TaxID=1610492 RepID=A0A239KVT4_9BACT|nr:lipid-A-disaccharide synthase [Pontibacter ummariensis]PRY04931.1 lipid-A-disaccharide synthase [Pontibacter ummariensis]SNT22466.1 lipid-A-disaccharide synthase [Pontibacter ummariensis]
MKYYIIAGERSGDLHASNLIKQLRRQDPVAEIRGWGGDMMQEAGMDLVHHYQEMAFMGFAEVFRSLRKILGFLRECKADIKTYQPDVVILVDYAGFNMRIARFAKKHGLKVYYYISPKIWAWNQGRVHKIKKVVDRMFVIMPFEEDFYARFDYKVDYVGNPVNDSVTDHVASTDFRTRNRLYNNKPIIAILPGSRRQEIESMLHVMLSVLPSFRDYQFVVAGVSNFSKAYYEQYNKDPNIKIIYDQTYDLLAHAQAALVTSGTATLETALFGVPQVVCYKTSAISYAIGKMVIKVPYISLVNLIADKPVVTELIQDDFTPKKIIAELKQILFDKYFIKKQKEGYALVRQKIGEYRTAERAAELMVGYLTEEKTAKA